MFIPWWVIVLVFIVLGVIVSHFENRVDELENRVEDLESGKDNDVNNLEEDELV